MQKKSFIFKLERGQFNHKLCKKFRSLGEIFVYNFSQFSVKFVERYKLIIFFEAFINIDIKLIRVISHFSLKLTYKLNREAFDT